MLRLAAARGSSTVLSHARGAIATSRVVSVFMPCSCRSMHYARATASAKEMELQKAIRDQTDASLSLAGRVISAEAKNSNFVFSPLSIHALLGLIASGSNGPTRDQILGYLKSKSLEELHALFSQRVHKVLADGGPVGGPKLSTAYGLWIDQSFTLKPSFRALVENLYKGVSKHVDFQNKAREVTEEVNAWAEKETKGLIKDILSDGAVDPSITKLILGNAIYFKGAWDRKFLPHLTEDRKFHLLNGSSVQAPMMSSSLKNQYVKFCDGFKVLRMGYIKGRDCRSFSMYIYLPDAMDGLPELRERVCSEPGFIDNHLPLFEQSLDDFRVPKFRFEFAFEASEALKELGVVLPFQGGELTEMVEPEPEPDYNNALGVTGMFHKSLIEVNEEGTEAAAVTLSGLGSSRPGAVKKRVEFVADHPFMFVIREDTTGLILFIGQLLNPLSTAEAN